MNHALGEVDSEIIKEARDMSIQVTCFVLGRDTNYKTELFVDCQRLYEMLNSCEFRRVCSLAELCKTVYINQTHAECIKQLKILSKRIDELQETK